MRGCLCVFLCVRTRTCCGLRIKCDDADSALSTLAGLLRLVYYSHDQLCVNPRDHDHGHTADNDHGVNVADTGADASEGQAALPLRLPAPCNKDGGVREQAVRCAMVDLLTCLTVPLLQTEPCDTIVLAGMPVDGHSPTERQHVCASFRAGQRQLLRLGLEAALALQLSWKKMHPTPGVNEAEGTALRLPRLQLTYLQGGDVRQ